MLIVLLGWPLVALLRGFGELVGGVKADERARGKARMLRGLVGVVLAAGFVTAVIRSNGGWNQFWNG